MSKKRMSIRFDDRTLMLLNELSNREQRNLLKELSSEIDSRLQDVGEEKDATPKYAEKVRKKFEEYSNPGKNGGIQRK